jgi:hypothetical protein
MSSCAVLGWTGAWLVAAFAVGASGLLRHARPPMPQIMIAALTAALLIGFWSAPGLGRWVRAVDLRALVLVHVTRFVGIYFLVLYGRGELPWAFAVPGGWGDIAVAATAVLVGLLSRPDRPGGRGVILAWNALGLADILMVVATAARLGTADPAAMGALLRLPLSLLPTFLVPIVIATHVAIFARLFARRR